MEKKTKNLKSTKTDTEKHSTKKEDRFKYYEELTTDEQQIILDYEEKVAMRSGNDDVKINDRYIKKKYGGHTIPPFVLNSMKIVVEFS